MMTLLDDCRSKGSRRQFGRWMIGAAVAIAATATALPAGAQDYPNHAVKIIVPFPAGGSADVVPRVVADWLSRKWGQPVVIENRPGAAGNIGAEQAYKAEPDGYTLLSAPPPPLVINQNLYPKLDFDPTKFDADHRDGDGYRTALVVTPTISRPRPSPS